MKLKLVSFSIPTFVLIASLVSAQPSLTLGTAVADGNSVSFPLTLSGAGDGPVSSLSGSVVFNPLIFSVPTQSGQPVGAVAGQALLEAGKRLDQAASYNSLTFTILSFGSNTPLPNGVVATVTLDIVSSPAASERFRLYSISGSDPYGAPVTLDYDPYGTPAPPVAQLSITLSGNGSGSVNSYPPGIACTGNTCNASFYVGSTVELLATPSVGSNFSGWSGACSGLNCSVGISSERLVEASFRLDRGVKVGNAFFGTLTAAMTAAPAEAVFLARNVSFAENMLFDRQMSACLAGGYASDFTGRSGYTTIDGSLRIRTGRVVLDRIKIR